MTKASSRIVSTFFDVYSLAVCIIKQSHDTISYLDGSRIVIVMLIRVVIDGSGSCVVAAELIQHPAAHPSPETLIHMRSLVAKYESTRAK
jgi:hypothetical protein